ncbi:MAG: universal stress protein [Xenococcaceae cyanobacterium MO_188.B29]|nr:universal stress protein [Xenococcaceae cyanobacterium MO_188.B29]
MDNILAAIDFSPITPTVVDKAAEIARCFASKLWLIHIAAPEPDFVGYGTGPQSKRDWRAKTLREEHRYIQDKALELEQSGIDVTPLLVQGMTVETILQEASKLKTDMIVIGSHGHGALYKALVGSVSAGIIRKASCPVLVVPAKTKS